MKLCAAVLSLLAVAMAAVFGPAPAAAQPADAFQRILDRYLEKEGLPGGVLLASGPGGRLVVVSGVADRRTKKPVDADTRFYVASIGKMAVATATLQLVEEGALSLDDIAAPLATGVPGLEKLPNVRKATVEQLLNHTSGIPDYLTDDFYKLYYRTTRPLAPADALPFAYGEKPANKPGKAYEYSNSNYVLLGAIIAAADNLPFDVALQRRVFDRAGMTGATVGADAKDPTLAHGYADPEETGKLRDVSRGAWLSHLGDGPLVATAADLERFAFALFRDGKLLRRKTLARMTAPSALEAGYGLGVEIGADAGGDWVGHTGRDDGFEAELRYYPDHKTVLALLTNGNAESDDSALDKAAKALFKK